MLFSLKLLNKTNKLTLRMSEKSSNFASSFENREQL